MKFDEANYMEEYVSQLIKQWHIHPYVWNLFVVVVSVFIGLIINAILSLLIKRKTNTKDNVVLKRSYFRHLVTPLSILIPIALLIIFLPVMRLNKSGLAYISHALEVAVIISFAWLLMSAVRVTQYFVNRKIDIHTLTDNLRQRRLLTQLMYVRRVINIIIILVATGAVLLTFETMRKLGTGLLTGVGIGGIIIGFAAQRSLSNLLAGFQIAFTQPIRIDDEVVVEGQFGIIEQITLTYVVVRIWDERRLVLPINYFIEKPFENWTRTTSSMHGTVYLYTDYNIPVEWLRNEFLRIVQAHPLWDKRTAILVVTDAKEKTMELRALMSAQTSGQVWDLRCAVREQLINAIAHNYPQSLGVTKMVMNKANNEIV
jgi:small-conductance mechanosensitive channel